MQQTRTDRSQEDCLWVSGVFSPPPASAAADVEPGAVIVDDAFAPAVVVAGASAPEAAVGEVAAVADVDVDDAVEETDAVAAVSPVPTSADDAVAGDSVAAAAVVVVAVEIVAGTPRGLLGPHLDAAAWKQVVVAAVAAVVSGVSHHVSVPHHLQQ